MTRKIIDPKNPPVLWSTVKDAFQDINANFQELYENGIGGNVDLSAVSQNIVPDTTEARGLGTTTKRWKDLYLSGDKIDLGGAIIRKAEDGGVAVPGLSTVRIQPFDVLLHESPAAGPYTGGTPVIIDKVTYTIATDPAFAADRDYVPTTYAAVLDEGNNIVDITVTNPSPYKQNGHITESEYSALNRSQGEFNNMYALPPGTNIDDWDALLVALATAVLPYGLIPCTVVSRSVTEVVGGIGVQGTQGTQGTQGIQGTTGAFAGQGIQGVQGASGPQGIQGTFGPQGIQGPAGGTGVTVGRTFYVTKNGNDTNPGTGPSTAFLTIKKALSMALAGETILVASGTYEEEYPLDVPAGVSVIGAGRHATVIRPSAATDTNDGFKISGGGTLSDFTMTGQYYKASIDSGYAFRFASGAVITSVLPYIERVTVLNRGRITTQNDPLGFTSTSDGNMAGRGLYLNGASVSATSTRAAMVLNEVTFEVPASTGIFLTNGPRLDMTTCTTYFADTSVLLIQGVDGIYANGKTKLRVTGLSGGYDIVAGHTISVVGGSNPSGIIESYNPATGIIVIDGYVAGFVEGVQDVRFTLGGNQQGTATEITFVDYKDFGAEVRGNGCSALYGNTGLYGIGVGVQANFFSHNFAYIGTGADITNDIDLVVSGNEVIVEQGARIVVNSVDQSGNIRIGVSDQDFVFRPNGTMIFPNGGTQSGAAIPVSDLKTLVAASTDFNDFKSRIAAL